MKAEQVDQALFQKFVTDDTRLVFWHDPNDEFTDYIEGGFTGDIAHVQVLNVANVGGLSAKLRLEREDPSGKYLVYSTGEAPPAEEDWLLDIRLYSAQFHADVASLWLQELGLSSLSLRDHLKARAIFLGSQDRRKRLARLITPKDDEATLDLKMMAVLVGSPMASIFDVLRALCHGHVQKNRFNLGETSEVITTFEKMDLLDRFWELMRSEFLYTAEAPNVAGLLRRLFISELLYQTEGAHLESLAHHKLPTAGGRNAVVFLTQWRDSSGKASSYDAAAFAVSAEQKIDTPLAALDLDAIKGVYTFWEAEKRVISRLKERLLSETHSVDVADVAMLVSERKAGHWLSGPGSDLPERRAIAHAYDAIVAAAELFALHTEHKNAMSFQTPKDLLAAYQKNLYRFDRLYRRFCTQTKPALGQGWDLLKTLSDEIDRVYDQGFLQPLGIEWSRLLDEGFLGKWSLKEMPAQQNFYAKNIRPHLAESERKRAFVIISDAFRYEAARELTESLNSRYRMNAKLSAMLGVLPSYTALGMASLLPHETLGYNDKGDVLVDGNSTVGTEARNKQLATVQGMACQAKDLLVMKQEDARTFTQDQRVVYIFHNVIDARGESASTEGETFDAVSDCIAELVELVQFCVNKLNAAKVWVTADHGFLYQQEPPDITDKSQLSHKPDQAVTVKKRYVIGRNLGTTPEAHHGSTDITANAEGEMEFWAPRAANLFHFTGGARFIHGGAMPQEVVVPLITVTQLRGTKSVESRSKKVSVQVLGTGHKITTPTYRFELIQTEAVRERRNPITLRVAVYKGEVAVTSVETITFDSTSDSIEDRKKSIRFELRKGTYDKTTPYRLVLRDVDSDAEVQSMPVVIDRSFEDDF
jgi:uncharacterized protein (TIGR02687 family)